MYNFQGKEDTDKEDGGGSSDDEEITKIPMIWYRTTSYVQTNLYYFCSILWVINFSLTKLFLNKYFFCFPR